MIQQLFSPMLLSKLLNIHCISAYTCEGCDILFYIMKKDCATCALLLCHISRIMGGSSVTEGHYYPISAQSSQNSYAN